MLRLLSLLQSGRQWPAAELADALGVPPRTLRRDIGQIRAMGYPVQSARGPGGHYRLLAGSTLPPLMLEDDEAVAAVLGLGLAASGGTGVETEEPADRARTKLRRILPPRLRRTADAVRAAVEFGPAEEPGIDRHLLDTVVTAVDAHRYLSFDHDPGTGPAPRTVEPVRLVRLRRRWYLYAWDTGRDDWRAFRLDRMSAPRVSGDHFLARRPPADDLAHHLQERFHGPRSVRVVLTLDTGMHDAAARLHRIDGTLEPLGEHGCRYTAHVDSFEWLTAVLAASDIGFRVEEPAEFARHLEHTARRLLGASRPDPDDRPAGPVGPDPGN
ncbi:WYL domain-containing protein [Nocardiopsis sp. HNM0947]|uniref:WYL domain-containing protein n=1 Tax=Nocardiopsis coralli TaxID=2772213 RepID=A0ABR9P9H0_9ACTN|nr:WYL domain-containing protein [Nocardiopsis coralli]